MVTIGAGRLSKRILFRAKGTTRDDYGEPNSESLTDFVTVYAEEMGISAMEKFSSTADFAFQVRKFRIRFRTDLNEDMVIDFNGGRYDIKGIEPAGRNNREWLIITALRNNLFFENVLGDLDDFTLGDLDDLTLGELETSDPSKF